MLRGSAERDDAGRTTTFSMKTTLSVILGLAMLAHAEDITLSAGPFVGADAAQTEYQRLLQTGGYQHGTDFTLSFTISSTSLADVNAYFLKLGDSVTLVSQSGGYVGFGTTTADPGSWLTSTWDANTKTHSYTVNGTPKGWFSRGDGESNKSSCTIGGSSYVISVVGNTTTLTMTRSDGVKNIVTVNNFAVSADDIIFNIGKIGGNGSASNTDLTFTNITFVPEPATATLSLLALAGLAVRRRRKQA